MANFVARYCGGDGHYADVECAYRELERYLVLSCNTRYWKEEGHQFGGLSYSRRAQELPPLVFEGCGLINPARKSLSQWCYLSHVAEAAHLQL
jgi:hypothetical protein